MDTADKNIRKLLLVRIQHIAERNELLDQSELVLVDMKQKIMAEIDYLQQKIKNENEEV